MVEPEVVVVVVSFLFKPSSLFSFDLHLVAFPSSTCCGGSGADVDVVVVVAEPRAWGLRRASAHGVRMDVPSWGLAF